MPSSHSIFTPSLSAHTILNRRPYSLHNLSISPPALLTLRWIPLVYRRDFHSASPALHRLWHQLRRESHIDSERVAEEFRRICPLVALELPRLAGCEDCYDARPVVGLEMVELINEDEAQRARRIDGGQSA